MKKNATSIALIKRYKDAYLHAKTVVGFGSIIKILAVVLGAIITTWAININNGTILFISIVSGVTTGVIIYFIGVNIAAQGQILQATLDSAVNSSPFLDNKQRARIMSLPLEQEYQGSSIDSESGTSESEFARNQEAQPQVVDENIPGDSLQCERCGGRFASRYYFANDGEANRLLCLECEKTFSSDEISKFMQRGDE